MTRRTYRVDIDRVIVRAGVERVDARELRALVERAVARELADAPLPPGRTMRAAVQIASRAMPAGAAGVASAVAAGVARAAGGPARG
jgi:hypothetical protein